MYFFFPHGAVLIRSHVLERCLLVSSSHAVFRAPWVSHCSYILNKPRAVCKDCVKQSDANIFYSSLFICFLSTYLCAHFVSFLCLRHPSFTISARPCGGRWGVILLAEWRRVADWGAFGVVCSSVEVGCVVIFFSLPRLGVHTLLHRRILYRLVTLGLEVAATVP